MMIRKSDFIKEGVVQKWNINVFREHFVHGQSQQEPASDNKAEYHTYMLVRLHPDHTIEH